MARSTQRSSGQAASQGFGRLRRPGGAGAAWEIAVRPQPFTVLEDCGAAFQPALMLVVEASGLVRAMQPVDPAGWREELPALLQQAIAAPASGCRRGRPSRVVVGSPELLEPLAALLPGVPLRRGATPLLEQAVEVFSSTISLESLEQALAEEAAVDPGTTYLTEDVTPAGVHALFAAAAALHARHPWACLPQEGHLFRVTSTALAVRQWLGCAIADDEEQEQAVLLFRSEEEYWDYERLAERADRQPLREDDPWPRHLVIRYKPLLQLSPALCAEIERHGWPLTAGALAPVLMLVEPERSFALPTAALLRQLQGVLWGLASWLDRGIGDPSRWNRRQQPKRVQVDLGDGVVPVSIGGFAGPPRRAVALDPLQARVLEIVECLDGFCTAHLNADYRQLLHRAVRELALQDPSPLRKGYGTSWCAGLVHAIGTANYLFEASQQPHCTVAEVGAFFAVSSSVIYAHSKTVRELLRIRPFSKAWTLTLLQQPTDNPQMVEINGLPIDLHRLPAKVRMQVCGRLLASAAGLHRRSAA